MTKSVQSGTGKKRRVDGSFESILQGGRYESADEILSKSVIPKMEGLSLNLEQMQKRLTKLDRENKLLRKETENLKFKSTYIPTSLKIECPKCSHTMDGPNDFISHLEKVHFYVEQECVIDKTNSGSLQSKVSTNSNPKPSFGSPLPETNKPIPEPNKPLRTGRIPKKAKSADLPLPTPFTRQTNHNSPKYQPVTPVKSPARNNIPSHQNKTPNNSVYRHNLRPHYGYNTLKHTIDPLSVTPPTHSPSVPRMRFQPHSNSYQVSPSVTPRQTTPYVYTGTNSIVPSPTKDIKTSPSQSGTIARARTAAPLFKTSPKLKTNTPVNPRPPIHNETQLNPSVSSIDLTESSVIEKSVVPKPLPPSGRINMSLPIPQLSVALNANRSVVIKLSLTKEQNIVIVANYEIMGYQSNQNISPPSPADWNRIGLVQAMSPPIECTLQRIGNGKRYSFVVRSIDISGCHGQFSEIHTIQV